MPKLIIFDCDGVLIDSEPIAHAVNAQELTKFGFETTQAEMLKRFAGINIDDMLNTLEEETDWEFPPELREHLRLKTVEAFRAELKAVPGIDHVLETLQARHIPYCVATNSQPERLNTVLEITKLAPFFDQNQRIDIHNVAHGKPAPDIFIYAAKQANARLNECIAVEDSAPGLIAAKAAGTKTIAFLAANHTKQPHYREEIERLKPDFIADSADALQDLLVRLFMQKAVGYRAP